MECIFPLICKGDSKVGGIEGWRRGGRIVYHTKTGGSGKVRFGSPDYIKENKRGRCKYIQVKKGEQYFMIDSDDIPMIICWFAGSDEIPQTIVRQLLDNYT